MDSHRLSEPLPSGLAVRWAPFSVVTDTEAVPAILPQLVVGARFTVSAGVVSLPVALAEVLHSI